MFINQVTWRHELKFRELFSVVWLVYGHQVDTTPEKARMSSPQPELPPRTTLVYPFSRNTVADHVERT